MGDNHHLYRHIRKSLMQIYPKQLTGRQAQQMNTLSGMIMASSAGEKPDESHGQDRARSKQSGKPYQALHALHTNEQVDATTYFLPFLTPLLIGLARSGRWY
ncbi:MAG: hypothetical protein IPG51_18315 [Chloroflexi bacterium]|nr:hypothetical protein [Chloroflexota bacterium]